MFRALAVLVALSSSVACIAGDSLPTDEEDARLPAGLVGRYFVGDRLACVRIDPSVVFDWTDGSPDDRIPCGGFTVEWEGQVWIGWKGTYRFSVEAEGPSQIWVDHRLVYSSPADEASLPLTLSGGYHAICVRYEAAGEKPRIRLIWSGRDFLTETLNPRYLAHEPAAEASLADELLPERGRQVVDRYGCARCHPIPGVDRSRRPGLAMPQASQLNRPWLTQWLRDPQQVRPGTRMGAPGGTAAEIEDFVSLLLAFLEQPMIEARIEPRWRCGTQSDPLDRLAGDDFRQRATAGRDYFYQLGCSACHSPEKPEAIDPRRAPCLADVGGKWSKAYLRQLLADPLARHPNGGMPDFSLGPNELDGLVAWLSTFSGLKELPSRESLASRPMDPQVLEQGKLLIQKRGCYACHHHPENKLMEGPRLYEGSIGSATGCLRTERSASLAPFYRLTPADRSAVQAFLNHRPSALLQVASGELVERAVHERLACFACHSRDGSPASQLPTTAAHYLGADPEGRRAALTVPDLSGVGARLIRPWLLDSLEGRAPGNRPWLTVRMPRFALDQREREGIARRLCFTDAIPGLRATPRGRLSDELLREGRTLFGAGGFNCVNCHYQGTEQSQGFKSAPDLHRVVQRVHRDWYDRWLSNPARILPGTAMPAFTSPVSGIAGDDLLIQKEIMWHRLEQAARLRPDDRQADVSAGTPMVRKVP